MQYRESDAYLNIFGMCSCPFKCSIRLCNFTGYECLASHVSVCDQLTITVNMTAVFFFLTEECGNNKRQVVIYTFLSQLQFFQKCP